MIYNLILFNIIIFINPNVEYNSLAFGLFLYYNILQSFLTCLNHIYFGN